VHLVETYCLTLLVARRGPLARRWGREAGGQGGRWRARGWAAWLSRKSGASVAASPAAANAQA